MRSHKSSHDIHRMVSIEFFQNLKHFDFGVKIQAVAAFSFTGSDAQAHHLIEKTFCLLIKLLKTCRSGLSDSVQNAASGSENV